jgi:hypothetical protein
MPIQDPNPTPIDNQGATTVYDTGDHRSFGVAQAQSSDQILTFTSQDGLVSSPTCKSRQLKRARDATAPGD